jgi:hypothetical protein
MLSPVYSNQDLTPWKHLRFALLGVLVVPCYLAPTTNGPSALPLVNDNVLV